MFNFGLKKKFSKKNKIAATIQTGDYFWLLNGYNKNVI